MSASVPTSARTSRRADPERWTKARLIEPSATGFVHIGASSGPWRLPPAFPRARRRAILAQMHAAATRLREDPRVARADVFRGLVRPPGRRPQPPGRNVRAADFDAVLLIEATTVEAATALLDDSVVTGLLSDLDATAVRTLAFAASNARRIGPVDHERDGIYLFNYFSADDAATNLFAWQYTAGWFQDRTGLDNSTVLQPVAPETVSYTLVNHCRWDHLRDIVPSLLFRPSFRGFVLRTFAANRVAPDPILYRRYTP